uniref:Uncharacterized protein tomE n=1 Tax=Prochloron didemni P1-Palau TaxID=910450 RepID=G0XS57_PRODI|nr:hypothetical protein [Prochloron didemni P1-Palau]
MRHDWIKRSTKAIEIEALHYQTVEQLRSLLGTYQESGDCICSDLSLGAWKGQWISYELSQQLATDLKLNDVLPSLEGHDYRKRGTDYADVIGQLIDAESEGDRNCLVAYDNAVRILQAISQATTKLILIVAPRFGFAWELENEWLIYFLANGIKACNCRLVLLFDRENPQISNLWSLKWIASKVHKRSALMPEETDCIFKDIPGTIDCQSYPQVSNWKDKSYLLQISDRCCLVLPEYRCNPEKVSPENFESLAALLNCTPTWMQAYLQAYGSLEKRDFNFLLQEARQRFSEGAYNIALRLIEKVSQSNLNEIQQAVLQVQAQSIRIAMMQFQDAAERENPASNLPPPITRSLYLSKAWGLVMVNRPEQAEPLFKKARDLTSSEEMDRSFLYLLNISALNQLKLGNVEQAMTFEKEIEDRLQALPQTDWHVTYINSINQARLYKRLGDWQKSEFYYKKAFQTTFGLRSESDQIYTNLCQAQIATLQKIDSHAFIFWFRVALHWLSMKIPEALAPRVAKAIVGRDILPEGNSIETISHTLFHRLVESVKNIPSLSNSMRDKIERLDSLKAKQICFARTSTNFSDSIQVAMGMLGWSILISDHWLGERFDGLNYLRLSRLVFEIICSLLPQFDFPESLTVFTDTRFGRELPATASELLEVAIRFEVREIYFGSKKINLSEEEMEAIQNKLIVGFAPGIDGLFKRSDRVLAHFKRYREMLELSEFASKIVDRIGDRTTAINIISDCCSFSNPREVWTGLRELEASQVLTLSV